MGCKERMYKNDEKVRSSKLFGDKTEYNNCAVVILYATKSNPEHDWPTVVSTGSTRTYWLRELRL